MLKIGLTGNIGSGKSIVSEMFSIFGVPVYHADAESKKFLDYSSVKEEIITLFGDDVIDPHGEIDKKVLASLVFSNEESLKKLNAVLHPLVIDDFSSWCEAFEDRPYVIQEAAVIYESGIANLFNKIIHVSCPKEIALNRVMRRDGITEELVLQRMQFQMDDLKKASLADFVIINDDKEMIIPQVLTIHEKLAGPGSQQ
jgi:dephospho-CoA kinase